MLLLSIRHGHEVRIGATGGQGRGSSCFDFREGFKVEVREEGYGGVRGGETARAHVLCPPGPKSYLDRPSHARCLSSSSTVWNCMVKPAPFWDLAR